jgi:hypothetical protein
MVALESEHQGTDDLALRKREIQKMEGGKRIMKKSIVLSTLFILACVIGIAYAALIVPSTIDQPGTQPQEVKNLESPDKCDNCHGGYNTSVEPAFNWRGSMMANAGRDPIFWATLAIAEQDFDGAGDLCIRCHSTAGWLGGRSTPTDGSGLASGDSDGVECDFCHKMTNPDNSDPVLQGVMNPPFEANDGAEGYYGSGMTSVWGGSDKLGPYADAEARHRSMPSQFHRSPDFCGTCHDVSNPAVGNLAHNFGAQVAFLATETVISDGSADENPKDYTGKAAFNNAPYKYGIVERTFSEYKAGLISQTVVPNYPNLPTDLQGGALEAVYNAALTAGTGGNYEDGQDRYFSCQTCHMRPVSGQGCNKNPPFRKDLPLHDMTGGNYWMPEAIKYLDAQNKLRLGGGLSATQLAALDAGILRAKEQLDLAATLSVQGNTVKTVNHTGHKLISGYPEGRRMWLNIKWYDDTGNLIKEDGEYGPISVQLDIDGDSNIDVTTVDTIIDLDDPDTKIYEAHYGMTQEWAAQLIAINETHFGPIVLSYDRNTGNYGITIAALAAAAPGTAHETFHFVLNNTVIKDNRIPPYGMEYETGRQRNALPVPEDQYNGGPGKTYDYFDAFQLNSPPGATNATIDLLYQPTSYEYQLFLLKANKGVDPVQGGNAFLGMEGRYMFEAWLNTGMAAPYVVASANWRDSSLPQCNAAIPTLVSAIPSSQEVVIDWDQVPAESLVDGYRLYYDQAGKAQLVNDIAGSANTTYTDTGLTNGQEYCYKVTSYYIDSTTGAECESGFSNIICAIPDAPGQTIHAGVSTLETGRYETTGKGKNKVTTFVLTDTFTAGDGVVIRAHVVDGSTGLPVANATVNITITGPETTTLTTGPSANDGIAEATWQTQNPNKKGQGGTTPGLYTATTTNVTADGYSWDGVGTSTSFDIQ